MAGPKALAKKLKTSTTVAIPAISSGTSSAHASTSAGEASADGTDEDCADMDKPTFSAGAEGGRRLEGMEVPEPSAANPLPNVMGGNSISEDAEATGCRVPSPPKETEAQEMNRRRPVAVKDLSDDEADSEPVARLQSATYRQL
jgi:type IV secretory pathway TrbL component